MAEHEEHLSTGPTRRTLLAAAGLAGVGAASLAACGNAEDQARSAVSSATDSAKSAVKEAIDKASIPVGGGKILTDQKIVVTQPTSGQFKAFSAVCTHQGCLVNKVADGVISCGSPCGHGSQYDAATGAVKQGPATMPLAEKKVTIDSNGISVS